MNNIIQNHYIPVYKKPVQPVIYQEEKKLEKPIPINNRKSLMNFSTDGRPTPDAPPEFQVAQYDNTKPTKYSFTYPTGKYNEQKSVYFPDAGTWKQFIGSQKLINSDEGEGYGTATGNLKFQKGGKFNPVEYLYGDDDDKEQPKKQEEIVVKKKRITEEDIDNSSEELKMLGLSEEDILGMISPTRRKRQSFQADSAIPNSSGVNPFVLKTQKDIFNQFQGVTNLGVWGDKSHQQRKSDHNSGEAQDFGIKDIESGNAIANKLIAEAKERGVKYIVFNKKIWNPSISNEWRPYKGSNPHKTHVHVSYNKDLKMYEQGGEYVVDFATMKELQSKGIKFKML